MSLPSSIAAPSESFPSEASHTIELPAQTHTSSESSQNPAKHWIIAGSVIGAVLLIGLGFGLFICMRKRRQRRRTIRPLDRLMSEKHIQDDVFGVYNSSSESSTPSHSRSHSYTDRRVFPSPLSQPLSHKHRDPGRPLDDASPAKTDMFDIQIHDANDDKSSDNTSSIAQRHQQKAVESRLMYGYWREESYNP